MGDYRKLRVWTLAHALTLDVYESTRAFPPAELYGITSQIRRAAASIPANLAEGCGRDSDAEVARFARNSLGSANELEYHILLARDLGMMPHADHERLQTGIGVIKGMLARLASTLSTTDRRLTTGD